MRGLKLFSRTGGRDTWNLISWHSPHHMCWSWLVSFHRFRGDEARVWPLAWRHNDNTTRRWGFRIPFVGHVGYQRQLRTMPYRDLYYQLQDRLNTERYEPPELPPPSPRLTIIDGGAALH